MTSKYRNLFLVATFSLYLFAMLFYPTFPVDWDVFGYISHMINREPFYLFLGRVGYIWSFSWFHDFLNLFVNFEYTHLLIYSGHIVTVLMYFLILAFLDAGYPSLIKFLLLSSLFIMNTAHFRGFAQGYPDPYMYVLALTGMIYLLHNKGHKRPSVLYAVFFGLLLLAISFKETVIYLAFFPILLSEISLKKKLTIFGSVLLLLVMGTFALSLMNTGPEYKYLFQPVLKEFSRSGLSVFNWWINNSVEQLLDLNKKLPLFFLIIPGVIFIKKIDVLKFLRCLVLVLPSLYFAVAYDRNGEGYERYTFLLFVCLASLYYDAAVDLLKHLPERFFKKTYYHIPLFLLLCFWNHHVNLTDATNLKNHSRDLQVFHDEQLPQFSEFKSALLVGVHTPVVYYFNTARKKDIQIIWTGWSWKQGGKSYLPDRTKELHSKGYRVFFLKDPARFTSNQNKNMARLYKTNEVIPYDSHFDEIGKPLIP